MSFTLAEATALRGLKADLIDARLNQRIEWREMARKRWRGATSGSWNEITEEIRQDLHTVCQTVLDSSVDCKLVVSTNFGWIYTNDVELIERLQTLRCLSGKAYTRAVVNRPKNTVLLKKSPHQHRAYLHGIKLTAIEKDNLANFFANQREHIRTSPSLTTWFTGPHQRTQDYFFIDYTSEQWLTMLSLIRPGLIRKTLEIVTK